MQELLLTGDLPRVLTLIESLSKTRVRNLEMMAIVCFQLETSPSDALRSKSCNLRNRLVSTKMQSSSLVISDLTLFSPSAVLVQELPDKRRAALSLEGNKKSGHCS